MIGAVSLPIPLGPFTLHDPIGEGGMGLVWGGIHRDSNAPVAIKTVRRAAAEWGHGVQSLFEREVRAVAALEHPAIVQVLDQGVVPPAAAFASQDRLVEGEPWLAMERCTGGSLNDQLGQLPFEEFRVLLLQILDGLAHAHARGVIHKDVKPANVLLAGRDDLRPGAKLVDFGIAALQRDPDGAGPSWGSPAYGAPEQYRDAPVGPRADLYALGCTAWAAAVGTPPHGLGERSTLIRRHEAGGLPPFVPAQPCPPGFGDWLRALIQVRPEDRPHHAADAADALRELGSDHGEGTGPRRRMMPRDWRTLQRTPLPDPLKGAGRGLLRLRRPPLVGRSAERDAMWRVLRAATEGAATGLVLLGPAGSGKTRLASWLAEEADERGFAHTLYARHSRGSVRNGFGPALAELAGAAGLERLEARAKVAARLESLGESRSWLADAAVDALNLQGTTDAGRPADRAAAAAAWLTAEARQRPLLLVVEDIHAGAEDALAVVERLLLAETPGVAAIITGRSVPSPRPAVLSELPARNLGGLEPRDVRRIVEGLLHLHPSLSSQLVESADGNPLFACQLLSDLAARDRLVATPDGFVARGGAGQPLPDSLHALWMERLRGIDGDDPRPLEIASLLGRTIDRSEWLDACGRVDAIPAPTLEGRLADSGFLTWTPGGWRFAHPLARESIERRSEEAGRRPELALACADALASSQRAHDGSRRGHLLVLAGRSDEAERILLEAAIEARENGDLGRAKELVESRDKALDSLGVPQEHPRRALGEVLRAELALRTGGRIEAFARTEALQSRAREHTWHEVLAWCEIILAVREREHGRLDEAEATQRSALSRFGAVRSPRGVGAAWMELAYTLRERGDYAGCRDAFLAAVPIWEELVLTGRLALTLGGIAGTQMEQGKMEEASSGLQKALDMLRRTGRLEERAAMLKDLATCRMMQGSLDEAETMCDRALALREPLGSPSALAPTWNLKGELARRRGRLDDVERCYLRSVELYEETGSTLAVSPRINLGLLGVERAHWTDARGVLTEALQEVQGKGRGSLAAVLQPILLACDAGLGDWPAYDRRMVDVQGFQGGASRVDVDTARCLDLAARIAREAGEAGEDARAEQARTMATRHWRALEG